MSENYDMEFSILDGIIGAKGFDRPTWSKSPGVFTFCETERYWKRSDIMVARGRFIDRGWFGAVHKSADFYDIREGWVWGHRNGMLYSPKIDMPVTFAVLVERLRDPAERRRLGLPSLRDGTHEPR